MAAQCSSPLTAIPFYPFCFSNPSAPFSSISLPLRLPYSFTPAISPLPPFSHLSVLLRHPLLLRSSPFPHSLFFSFSTPGQPAIPSFDIDSFVPFPSRRILLLFFRRRGQILRPKWLQGIGRSFQHRVSEERQPLSINEYIVRAASFVIRLSIKDNGNRAKGRPTDSAFPVDAVKPATCRCNVLAEDVRVGFPVRPLANIRAR